MLSTTRAEGQGTRDWMQERCARIGQPKSFALEGWSPIDTAPRNGSPVMVRDGAYEPYAAFFVQTDLGGYWKMDGPVSFTPTLWKPI